MSCNTCTSVCDLNPCFVTTIFGTVTVLSTNVDIYFERLSDGRIYQIPSVQTDSAGVLSIGGADLIPGFLDFLDFGGMFRFYATVEGESERYDITPYVNDADLGDTTYNCLTVKFDPVFNAEGRVSISTQTAIQA